MTSRRNFRAAPPPAGIAAATFGRLSARHPPRRWPFRPTTPPAPSPDVEHVVILMPGEPLVRPLLRHAQRRARLRRPLHHPHAQGPQRLAAGARQRPADHAVPPGRQRQATPSARRARRTPGRTARPPGTTAACRSWPGPQTNTSMGYFKEDEIPFQFALANAFTLCDAYHCAMHTGTDANRSFHMTGTNGAMPSEHGPSSTTNGMPSTAWPPTPTSATPGRPTPSGWRKPASAGSATRTCPTNGATTCWAPSRPSAAPTSHSGFPVSSGGAPGSPVHQHRAGRAVQGLRRGHRQRRQPALQGHRQHAAGRSRSSTWTPSSRTSPTASCRRCRWINAPSIYCEHPGPSTPGAGRLVPPGSAGRADRRARRCGARPCCWSTSTRTTATSTTCRRRPPRRATPTARLAGKTTLPATDMAAEYYTQSPPVGSTSQPARDGRVYGPGPRVPMFVISPVEPGRLGQFAGVRPHVGAALPGGPFRRAGAQHQPVPPRGLRRPAPAAFNFETPNSEALPTLAGRTSKRRGRRAARVSRRHRPVPVPPDTQPCRSRPPARGRRAPCPTSCTPARAAHRERQGGAAVRQHRQAGGRVPRLRPAAPGPHAAPLHGGGGQDPGRQLGRDGRRRRASTTCGCWARTASIATSRATCNALRADGAAQPEVRVCYDIANGNVYLDHDEHGHEGGRPSRCRAKAYRSDGPWAATVAGDSTVDAALDADGQRPVVRLRRDPRHRHRATTAASPAAWRPASTRSATRRWAWRTL